ncbi:condensation domain-containing protein [Streptomyces sp. NRRL F-5123]|uniref:condensation domain-containing protein n=1 Tax=Streptomyces sp. NRRL F-5123 TaxID=1463856 RepID=UPI0006950447|nr:condensation domain-containing protein [Streptomyces sp. NRRL F-5123]
MNAPFAASDAGIGPLTWGQLAIWDAIERTVPDDHYFNFGRILKVPGVRTSAEVRAALGGLVSAHGALRTRLDLAGPRPRQRLAARGELTVERCSGDPEAVLAGLVARPFDYEAEWPLRVALVTDGPRVGHVVLAFCHVAADGLGADVAVRDLRLLLLRGGGVLAGTPAPRPLDLARWQAGPEGRRAAGRAARLWEKVPHEVMFDRWAGAGERPRVRRALLASPAMDLAVRAVAARHRTSTSTVLLAATAALVGRSTERERCAVLPIASNRFRRDTARIVGMVSQEGVFALDGVGRPFGELLRAADPAALRAYRSAFHDPVDRARGGWAQPLCCFNDQRPARPDPAPCAPAEIRAALPASRLSWPLGQDRLNCRFCVHVSGNLEVSVTADTAYLPRPDIERFLLGLESLLVAEAGA